MQHYHDELVQFFTKWSSYIVGTAIGVIGKISFEIGMKRKMSLWQWFGIVGVSIFAGYLVSALCAANGWDAQAGYLVPISTLLGEKLLIYITNNYQAIFGRILSIFTKKK